MGLPQTRQPTSGRRFGRQREWTSATTHLQHVASATEAWGFVEADALGLLLLWELVLLIHESIQGMDQTEHIQLQLVNQSSVFAQTRKLFYNKRKCRTSDWYLIRPNITKNGLEYVKKTFSAFLESVQKNWGSFGIQARQTERPNCPVVCWAPQIWWWDIRSNKNYYQDTIIIIRSPTYRAMRSTYEMTDDNSLHSTSSRSLQTKTPKCWKLKHCD